MPFSFIAETQWTLTASGDSVRIILLESDSHFSVVREVASGPIGTLPEREAKVRFAKRVGFRDAEDRTSALALAWTEFDVSSRRLLGLGAHRLNAVGAAYVV